MRRLAVFFSLTAMAAFPVGSLAQTVGPTGAAAEASAPDTDSVATANLHVSAGSSRVEQLPVDLSVRQNNFRGLGQQPRVSVNYAPYAKPSGAGFTEPYAFDRKDAAGAVRLVDRFQLGKPQLRGFDIRGVGPRVTRRSNAARADDATGGRYRYLGQAELELPLGPEGREIGMRPSAFVDVGALWGVRSPQRLDPPAKASATAPLQCRNIVSGAVSTLAPDKTACPTGSAPIRPSAMAFREYVVGTTHPPRVAIGVGANWNSPFGPLRIDIAKPILNEGGDDTRLFTFNVGTAF